jgi:hypothetical protein
MLIVACRTPAPGKIKIFPPEAAIPALSALCDLARTLFTAILDATKVHGMASQSLLLL